MSGDILERLRRLDDWLAGSGTAADELLEAADEIERLQRWKAESMTLLKQWNQIADDVIRLPDIVASELERLRAENEAALLIISDLEAEVERLRAERDDHKQRLAVEAVTAPDADYDTMMDSLQARLRDLHAEVERLRAAGNALVDAVERQQWSTVDVAVAAWEAIRER